MGEIIPYLFYDDFSELKVMQEKNQTKNAIADATHYQVMKGQLAKDQSIERPEGVSNEDFSLFERRRRAERARIDEAEGKLTTSERTQFVAGQFKRKGLGPSV